MLTSAFCILDWLQESRGGVDADDGVKVRERGEGGEREGRQGFRKIPGKRAQAPFVLSDESTHAEKVPAVFILSLSPSLPPRLPLLFSSSISTLRSVSGHNMSKAQMKGKTTEEE